ncbi:hypothetical protein [Roseobacter sp. HKCCA0434]|uniref:hypothetical protein n=1 Tax=Roseobacter sp. HKCCA0434 TaxID=3079297 RepID=UPI002905A6D5|nr:hypothetical protein [Roseobacter sp. HKCCA0434]
MSWWHKFRRKKAKAKPVRPDGDHIENLQAHPTVDIPKIGETSNLPVWIDVSSSRPTTATYYGLLWEIEPMGEYLYYLAGDFQKNEKGLLRYASAKTSAEVHVCFEDDVISVNHSEMSQWSEVADEKTAYSTDFPDMKVEELTAFVQPEMHKYGNTRLRAKLGLKDLHGGAGYMELANGVRFGPSVRYFWSKHTETSQGTRVTKILVGSSDPDQHVRQMHDLFSTLVDRYQDIEDHPLSGAIRM